MSELIPVFDFQRVIVEPWTIDRQHFLWVALMGFFVAAACGLTGVYLILRRMALVGDAISHSVLPGLAIAFLVGGLTFKPETPGPGAGFITGLGVTGGHEALNPTLMFIGALLAGVVTTLLIEVIHKKTRVKQDAAIGITFSSLFAFGVILISVFADKIDLDADCVLYGEIGFVTLHPYAQWGGTELAPWPVVRMGVVLLLTAGLMLLFYKELLVSSFDSGLATSLGIKPGLVHYALMCWLSVVVVSAFEAVGAILVIAMLILPGATASLLSQRLPAIFLGTLVHAALSALAGLHLAIWLDCPAAGAMVVAGAILFCAAWLLSPSQGLIATGLRRRLISRDEPGLAGGVEGT